MTFCVSCGSPVTSVAEGPGSSPPGSDSPGRTGSLLDDLRGSLRQSVDGLRGSFSGIGRDSVRELPGRTLGWFRDLSGLPKMVLIGLVALVLLVVLSPVVAVAAAVLLLVSIVFLIFRVRQKGSLKNWGLVAVASVILVFTFGGISGALYGIGLSTPFDSGQTIRNSGATPVSTAPPDSNSESGSGSELPSPADIGPTTDGVPYYEVTDFAPAFGGRGLQLKVRSDIDPAYDEQEISAVINDIQAQTAGRSDYVTVLVSGTMGPLGTGYISHSDVGQQMNGVPTGTWEFRPFNP